MFVSNRGVIHFVIIYIGKHSLEKLTEANVPHYAFLYIFSFFDMCITLYQYMLVYKNSTK